MLILLACAGMGAVSAQSIKADTTHADPGKYSEELGYFRKAYSDLGDPRFMLTDGAGKFAFGLGATFSTLAYYDYAGALSSTAFVPFNINIPTDYANHYGLSIQGSEMHIKARGYIGKNKVVAFMKLVSKTDLSIKISQAYLSFNGITVGQTYSFFMDLEAGPMTIDLQGPNSQVAMAHPLVGYTRYLGERWMLGAALEESQTAFSDNLFDEFGVRSNYRSIPDIAMRVKYRGDKGHVQLSALVTDNAYWCDSTFKSAVSGVGRHVWGWGVSLSGNWNPFDHVGFSGQLAGGQGISDYLQDLAGNNLKFYTDNALVDGYLVLHTRWAFGGYLSANIRWNEMFRSSLVYGISYMPRVGEGQLSLETDLLQQYKASAYALANFFWMISPYARMGVEFVTGYKEVYPLLEDSPVCGIANRVNAVFVYQF